MANYRKLVRVIPNYRPVSGVPLPSIIQANYRLIIHRGSSKHLDARSTPPCSGVSTLQARCSHSARAAGSAPERWTDCHYPAALGVHNTVHPPRPACFTSVFGMGTGGTRHPHRPLGLAVLQKGAPRRVIRTTEEVAAVNGRPTEC
jgi:hypothetical protein